MNKLLCLYSISQYIRGANTTFVSPLVAKCILLERAVSAASIEFVTIVDGDTSLNLEAITLDRLAANHNLDEINDYVFSLPATGEWGEWSKDKHDRFSFSAYEHHGYTILSYFRALSSNSMFNVLLSKQSRITTKIDDIDNIKKLGKHNVVKLNGSYFGDDFVYIVDEEIVVHLGENEFGIHFMKTGRNCKYPYHIESDDVDTPKLAVEM